MIGNSAGPLINFRKELILALSKQGYTVYCLVSDFDSNSKAVVEELGAVPIDSPLNSKGVNPIADILATIKLSRILKTLQPDVVFSFFVKPVIFGTIAAKLAKVTHIIGMIEGLGNAFTKSNLEKLVLKTKAIQSVQILLYKLSLPLLDTLIFLNPDDKEDLLTTFDIQVNNTVILGGIGVDLNKFQYKHIETNRACSFIFIARLLREKGIYEYLEAAEKVKLKYPNTKFYVLGGFDDENPFALHRSELEPYLSTNTVEYLGYVDNVIDYLIEASVFVLPSYREGVPRSTQEAMAVGRPIITTDVPGCRETVKHGVNGFLVPPYNSDILAKKMMEFIVSPDLLNQMGNESRKMAELKYNINNVNDKLISLIIPEKFKG